MLALVEGWVDEVVHQAAVDRLPSEAAMRETLRRRRAAGGPAEATFETLVGLQLRPRRLREAAAFWAMLGQTRGQEGRDALWAHPDLLPTTEDLDDPQAFLDESANAGTPLDLSTLDDTPAPTEDRSRGTGFVSDGCASTSLRNCAAVDARDVRSGGELLPSFERIAEPAHSVGSVSIAQITSRPALWSQTMTRSRVLLGLHAKVGRWLQFGGHIEAGRRHLGGRRSPRNRGRVWAARTDLGEHPPDRAGCPSGAMREMVRNVTSISSMSSSLTSNTRMFSSDESLAVSWFDASDLPADTDASVRRLVRAAVDQLRSE